MHEIAEGNGNPLQYSCLENSVDRGAWWAAVHGVAQCRTQLKLLSMHTCIGERNGNPLQCSCLENPRDSQGLSSSSNNIHEIHFSFSLQLFVAAAAGKSLQSCPTLCDPIDGSPPGSPVPAILQARTLEWVAISFSNA